MNRITLTLKSSESADCDIFLECPPSERDPDEMVVDMTIGGVDEKGIALTALDVDEMIFFLQQVRARYGNKRWETIRALNEDNND